MSLALKARLKCGGYILLGAPNRKIAALISRAFSAGLINFPFPRAALPAEAGRSLSPRLS